MAAGVAGTVTGGCVSTGASVEVTVETGSGEESSLTAVVVGVVRTLPDTFLYDKIKR